MSIRRFVLVAVTAIALSAGGSVSGPVAVADEDDPGDGGPGITMKWKHKWVKTRYIKSYPDHSYQMCRLSLSRPFIDGNKKRPVRARMVLRCKHRTTGTQGCYTFNGYHVGVQTCGYLLGSKWKWSKKRRLYKYKVERGLKYVGKGRKYRAIAEIWTGAAPKGTKRYRKIVWERTW